MKELKWALVAVGLVAIAGFMAYTLIVSERSRNEAVRRNVAGELNAEAEALESKSSGEMDVTLFFYNPQGKPGAANFLKPETRTVFRVDDPLLIARQVILELSKGPQPVSDSGDPALQSETDMTSLYSHLKLRQVYLLEQGTAVVDLETPSKLPGGILNELALIESVTRSLRQNLDQIREVRFLINGKPSSTFGEHVSLARPFR